MIHPSSLSSSNSSSSSTSGSRLAAPAEEEDKSANPHVECYVCGRRFGAWKSLFGHMRCHPEREWRGVRPLLEGEEGSSGRSKWRRRTADESSSTAAIGGYACGGCSRVFETRQSLGGHRASHRGVMGCSAKAKEAVVAVTTEEEKRGGGEKRFGCQVCGREFRTYHGMRVHQRVHRGRRGEERGFMVDLNLPPPPEGEGEGEEDRGNGD